MATVNNGFEVLLGNLIEAEPEEKSTAWTLQKKKRRRGKKHASLHTELHAIPESTSRQYTAVQGRHAQRDDDRSNKPHRSRSDVSKAAQELEDTSSQHSSPRSGIVRGLSFNLPLSADGARSRLVSTPAASAAFPNSEGHAGHLERASCYAGGDAANTSYTSHAVPRGNAWPGGKAPWQQPPSPADTGQSFRSFLQAELNPGPSYPTTDVLWGQTERDRVYNAILFVPYQLERFLWYGVLICTDSFLAMFTLLPIRFLVAVACLLRRTLAPARCKGPPLRGDQLNDILMVAIFAAAVAALCSLNAGAMYFWMKDLSQELLKLHVIYTAIEIFDKIFCNFGVDTLEALTGTCTQAAAIISQARWWHVGADALVAAAVVVLHGAVIMCQGMVFSVAMNSKRPNTLVALLIAANFAEIKGTIFKRWDSTKLLTFSCQDAVERFHLILALLFVVVEEMNNAGHSRPNPILLAQSAQVFGAEIVIDVIKHAVLGKFNDIRPGVYREFMKDLCEKMRRSQSHNEHRALSFEPIAPAALFTRILVTLFMTRVSGPDRVADPAAQQNGSMPATPVLAANPHLWWQCIAGWACVCVLRTGLGFALRLAADAYAEHYDRRHSRSRGRGRPASPARMPHKEE